MFISELNTAERLQQSIEARTIDAETEYQAYPCYGNSETDKLLTRSDKALQTANDFESYIDMQLDGIDFNNYLV